jgi:hypothetical protein
VNAFMGLFFNKRNTPPPLFSRKDDRPNVCSGRCLLRSDQYAKVDG